MNLFLKLAFYALCACCGYFSGCHNLAHILSKRRGFDIRSVGSNNPGTSNTVITMGWKAGVMVGAHDIFKAFIPAVLAGLLLPQLPLASTVTGVAAVLGHIFPITLGFRGGKGFAPYIGMMFALNWKFGLVIVVLIILITLITDYIALATFTTVISFPAYSALVVNHYWMAAIVAIASAVIVYRHRENIIRIANGTEIGLRRARKTKDSHH
ncbi:MAG: glycerol-3-phosphate acyltransferase [Ruminococcaceae bacterium]|nr:glycerol-3-phosphate acyltransferase [Oscillospiraceae bacterium]